MEDRRWGVGNWKREVVIIFARLGTSERQTLMAVLQQIKKERNRRSGRKNEGMMKIHKRDN